MTRCVLEHGFIDSVVWVFPDHWASFRLIANLTFFITPRRRRRRISVLFQRDEDCLPRIEPLLVSKAELTAASYDSARSLGFRIHSGTFSELQRNAELIPSQKRFSST